METDYRLIAESAEDSIYIVGRDLVLTYVNAYGAGMLGGSPEMIVGQNLADLFSGNSAKNQAKSIEKVFKTRKPVYMEDRYGFGDRGIWLSTKLIPILGADGGATAVIGISRDISDLKTTERSLKKSERTLQQRLKHSDALSELGSTLLEISEAGPLLEKMTEGIGKALNLDRVLIYRIDFRENVVDGLAEWLNPKTLGVESTKGRYELDVFINGALDLWKNRKPLVSHYNEVNPVLVGDKSSERLHNRMKIKSLLWYPFDFREQSFYALVLNQVEHRREWTDEEFNLLGRMITDVAIALQKIELMKNRDATDVELRSSVAKLKQTLEETVTALALTAEKKDPYTAGHQRRVVELAVAIAGELNLSEEKTEGIRIAAIVHDIGKIYIPAEILAKPTKLTDLEFGVVQTHSQFGFDILKTVDFPWPIAKVVLQHHERLDGSGYPLGLKDDEICQEARILAVADVIEAMVSYRPYRASLDIKKALAELQKGSGVLYDAQVVKACAKVLRSKDFVLD